MKASCLRYLFLVLCLLLTCCVTDSVNPLASPDICQADPRLVGDWIGGTGADRSICRFSITKAPWMHVDIIPDPVTKPKKNDMPESYDFYPTIIGKTTFLNVVMTGKDDRGHPTQTYLFLRYRISHDHVLQMWMMSQELAAAAVRSGKLKGVIKPTGFAMGKPAQADIDVTLQDTGANMTKFIQGSNINRLFNSAMTPLYPAVSR